METLRVLGAKALVVLICVAAPIGAQVMAVQPATSDDAVSDSRARTGGAQTLEDILARQRGEKIDDRFRRDTIGDPAGPAAVFDQLGTLGGASDPEIWRALRYGNAAVRTSNAAPGAGLLVQDSGMTWLELREGPLRIYGGYAISAILVILAIFYLLRGRIRIEGGRSGTRILRFNATERFGHWLLAGSFIVLAITGLTVLFGRPVLIPVFGKDAFAVLATTSKWVHNNVSWAFVLGLIMVFMMWGVHNLPNKHDMIWLAKGGGLLTKYSHPQARKFNAGQKLFFWFVILLGVSVAASGLSLLFPFEMPMFAKTFQVMNDFGLPGLAGMKPLPAELLPHAEMQLAHLWHAIVGIAMIVIIVAHIYLGSIGMEGAFDAVGTGEVDLQWARENHSLWVEELEAVPAPDLVKSPAE